MNRIDEARVEAVDAADAVVDVPFDESEPASVFAPNIRTADIPLPIHPSIHTTLVKTTE